MERSPGNVPEEIRSACAWVAARARSVQIEESAIEAYASQLPATTGTPALDPETHFVEGEREARVAFVLCLDAINFGSGWWPTLRKRPGHSGYSTVAAGLTDRFRSEGAWSPEELTRLSAGTVAGVLGQDPAHPLMGQFAASLRDVGAHVREEHDGSWTAVIDAADGSAVSLVDLLSGWEAFADESTYAGRPVPFFKRAQIAAADVNRAGVANLRHEHRLTAFADNLVPHVLRLDGILQLDPALAESIDTGGLLTHESAEEVELRACTVHAVELLSTATDRRISPAEIDGILWNRGGQARYKAMPRPRSRNTAY